MAGSWRVERERGGAAVFHQRPVPEPARRAVTILDVDRPALVLGSTQPEADVDATAVAAAGVDLVRRRSGGGAVLLEPAEALWVDLVVPSADAVWDVDVGRSFHWLGDAWAAALGDLALDAAPHTGPLVSTAWSRRICFAGLGPGEVTIDGRKVVGLAQRRSRGGARFQCVLLRRWDPAPLLSLLRLAPGERQRAVADLRQAALGVDVPFDAVVDALLTHLP